MKSLNKALVVMTALSASALATAAWWSVLDPIYSQVGVFVLAGLFTLYYKEKKLILLDVILLPMVTAAVFSQGLMSVCLDLSIFYYLVYRFGPKTEENSLLGVMLLLPLLVVSKLGKVLPEEYIIGSSWLVLGYIGINWPIQKFEFKNNKNWLEWFYCFLAITTYVDSQLINIVGAQYGLVILALMALLSRLPKLAMLFGLLTVHCLGAFDSQVVASLFALIWFDVYGLLVIFLLSPFFTKQPSAQLAEIITYYLGLILMYASATELFVKAKYKEIWQFGVVFFLLLIPLYETGAHWQEIQFNIEGQNWWSMIPVVTALLTSYLMMSSKIKPLNVKYNLEEQSYILWKKTSPTDIAVIGHAEFQKESEVGSALPEPVIIAITVGLTVITLGFLWLASLV